MFEYSQSSFFHGHDAETEPANFDTKIKTQINVVETMIDKTTKSVGNFDSCNCEDGAFSRFYIFRVVKTEILLDDKKCGC